ncbi:unnamed protein product [Urochloa humidicola]
MSVRARLPGSTAEARSCARWLSCAARPLGSPRRGLGSGGPSSHAGARLRVVEGGGGREQPVPAAAARAGAAAGEAAPRRPGAPGAGGAPRGGGHVQHPNVPDGPGRRVRRRLRNALLAFRAEPEQLVRAPAPAPVAEPAAAAHAMQPRLLILYDGMVARYRAVEENLRRRDVLQTRAARGDYDDSQVPLRKAMEAVDEAVVNDVMKFKVMKGQAGDVAAEIAGDGATPAAPPLLLRPEDLLPASVQRRLLRRQLKEEEKARAKTAY